MIHRIAGAAALVSLVSQPASAAPTQVDLDPTSKWNVDYGIEQCSLMREFGSGTAAVHLQIDSFGSWNAFRVLLTGTAVPRLRDPAGIARVRRSPDPNPSAADTLQGSAGAVSAISFNLNFIPYLAPGDEPHLDKDAKQKWRTERSRPNPGYDATVEWISVLPSTGANIVLHTGSMAKPLAALRSCVDDLYKSWGADPAQQSTLSREPSPTEATLRAITGEYPHRALINGTNAYVPVRLMVDAAGRANSCVVQAEGIDKDFMTAVCDHLQGKFDPALDAEGKPVASIFHTYVIYLLGGLHQ